MLPINERQTMAANCYIIQVCGDFGFVSTSAVVGRQAGTRGGADLTDKAI